MSEKNKDNKSNWAIGLSIVAIVLCLLVSALWIFETIPHSIITPDTFIGVIVALLAIIVNIVLGWQIYNAIDIKQKVGTIGQIKAELQQQAHRMEQMYDNACHSHGYVAADQAAARGDFVDAYRWLVSSLQFAILMDEPMNVCQTLNDMERFAKDIPQGSKLDENLFIEMNKEHKTIISSKSYPLIKDRYDASYKLFISKVKPQ